MSRPVNAQLAGCEGAAPKRPQGGVHGVRRSPGPCALLAAIAGLLLVGCGGSLSVTARLPRPARLAARAFPLVYITSAGDLDAEMLAEALARHLEAPGGLASSRPVRAERLAPEAVARLRAGGRVGSVSIVIRVAVEYHEDYRLDYASRPMTVCGPGGCALTPRPRQADLATLRARARFAVEDGPSGRRLEVVTLEVRDEGGDPLSMRARALLELRQRLPTLVDGGQREVELPLLPVDDPGARVAVALAEAGDWAGAAEAFRRLVAAPDFTGRTTAGRAALLFDLGQAIRASPAAGQQDALARLDGAADALRAALRLDLRPLFAEALAALDAQRRDVQRAAAQHEAAAHNFGLAAPPAQPGGIPAVPEGYR